MALANSLIQAAWHVLSQAKPHQDLGPDYFLKLDEEYVRKSRVRRLERMGHRVTLAPAA